MIKILNRIATGVAVGEEGVVISWRGEDSSGKESFFSDFIDTPWSSVSPEFDEGLKDLVDRSGLNDVNITLSVPDSLANVSILTFEELPDSLSERESLIKWTVSKNLHIPESNLIIDYHLLDKSADSKVVIAVAIEVNLISVYEDVFKKAGLNVWSAGTRTLHSLALMDKVVAGCKDYVFLYYGEDYFTLLIFKNNEIDFIRTKDMSSVGIISREMSSTLRSYLGNNPDYEYEKFFVLTSNKNALKDLSVDGAELVDQAQIVETYSIDEQDAPTALLLASAGAIKG